MVDTHSISDITLLSACAIVRWFDLPLLQHLTACSEAEFSALLERESNTVVASEPPGVYSLTAQRRAELLDEIRAVNPAMEVDLHTRALKYFVRCLRAREQPLPHSYEEAACFFHLERLFYHLYQRDAWNRIAQHVAEVQEVNPQQPEHRHRLRLYSGYVLLNEENYARAEQKFFSLHRHPSTDVYTDLRALNGLALVHMYQTRYDRALSWLEQLLQYAEKHNDFPYQGAALANMGMIHTELGQYHRALSSMQRSLDIFRRLGDVSRQVYLLYEIGNTSLQMGRWDIADRHLHNAVVLAKELGLTARMKNIYWGLGFLNHMQGELDASEIAYRRALNIVESSDVYNPRVASDILWFLGFLYHTEERWNEAAAAYNHAYRLAEELDRPHRQSLIQHRRGDVFRRQRRRDEAYTAFTQAIETIEGLRGAAEGEEIKLGLIDTTQQLYEAMVLLCLDDGRDEDAFDYVERARSQAFLDMLAQKAPELYEKVDQPVVTLDEVQAALPADAVLLEYFTTGVVPPGDNIINNLPPESEHLREYLASPPYLFCFAVTREQFDVLRIPLEPNLLQPKSARVSPARRLLRPRQLHYLYDMLVAPVESLLRDRDLLYIVPHGPLHYVPWMALRASSGEYLLASDGPAIALAPSATILLRNCLGRTPSHEGGFLALGYNDEGDDALRYAETEAEFLAHVMAGEAWTGPQPKTERLAHHDGPVRWLHVSGHGVFRPHAPLDSELRLGKDDAPSARDVMSTLDLDVDLVTLSACTSGLNHVVPGDELLGLPRAFLYAGAPTVICTPWEAGDLVALLVMERFYRELRAGAPPAHALRDAQVAVRTMTGRELLATLARWRCDYPDEWATLDVPTIRPQQLDEALFADPTHWALFTLIGRP